MASIHDIYPEQGSDRLKADDLLDPATGIFKVIQVTVESLEVVDFSKEGEKAENKIVLSFVGKDKSAVVNKTNAGKIGARYGADYDLWVGKDVIVTGSPKDFNGKQVNGLDITPIMVPDAVIQQEVAAANASQGAADAFDNETVPF
jgi:hypothetical protein